MSAIFETISDKNHEQVVYCNDPLSGLKAIIAIHNTVLGPALGGCRMYPYKSEDEALVDVLRLSKGMTYKASISNLNLGGGKAVIIGDPKTDKSEELLADLRQRTGLDIIRYEIKRIDFLRDVANISIYFYEEDSKK